jgi:integrase
LADDLEPAAPPAVMSYWQALDAARRLGRRQPGAAEDHARPLTVREALDRYRAHLVANEGDPVNASRVLGHVPPSILGKPVALLSPTELKAWRDHLASEGLKASTVNRICAAFKGALNHAAAFDHRVSNVRSWRTGLAALPNAYVARNVILDDDTVRRVVAASYARDEALGLIVELLATCGARFSQAARLTVGDLQPDKERVMMPRSAKGRNRAKRHERLSAPLPPALIDKLAAAAGARPPGEPLLLQDSGVPWRAVRGARINEAFSAVVAGLGLGPEVTPYSLRHSAAVRMLKANTPIRIVAGLLDSSVLMLEKSYSAFITEHAETIARAAMVSMESPAGDKVVALAKR